MGAFVGEGVAMLGWSKVGEMLTLGILDILEAFEVGQPLPLPLGALLFFGCLFFLGVLDEGFTLGRFDFEP